jgi:hypothetical protein
MLSLSHYELDLAFICYLIATWLSFCDLHQIKTMDISPILAHGYSTERQVLHLQQYSIIRSKIHDVSLK